MFRRIFKDKFLDALFWNKGFVTMPYLRSSEIKRFTELCAIKMPLDLSTLYSNIYAGSSYEYNVQVTTLLKEIFSPLIDEYLIDYSGTCGSFLVKGIGSEGVSKIHQDWNVVDENHCISLSIWCPMVDVDETNGALYVIPGSHRLFKSVRSSSLLSTRLEFDQDLEPFIKLVPMKAGEVCIYAHSLFHGSKPNNSKTGRVAVSYTLIPKEAKFIHYYHNSHCKSDQSEVLEIDIDFYHCNLQEAIKGIKPAHTASLGIIKHEAMPLQRAYILEKLRQQENFSITEYNRQSP